MPRPRTVGLEGITTAHAACDGKAKLPCMDPEGRVGSTHGSDRVGSSVKNMQANWD